MKTVRKIAGILCVLAFIWMIPSAHATRNQFTKDYVEFRGVWVATVSNIDIQAQPNLTEQGIKSFQDEFLEILEVMKDFHMNAMFFQVRPLNDAFYESSINPWSRFLVPTEGDNPGWDPLAWMIEKTQEAGIEFHAWLNPYRASLDVLPEVGDYSAQLTNYLTTLDDKNFAKNNPELLLRGGQRILLDPSKEEVRQHVYDTIEEIVYHYNVDGIHFDDYFYNAVRDEEDESSYQQYRQTTNNPMSKGDWRRNQVDELIYGIHTRMEIWKQELNRHVEFGISPAAGWASDSSVPCTADRTISGGMNISCWSYSSYFDLFADTKKWVEEEWIDYIIPQNYGAMGPGLNFAEVTRWWNEITTPTRVKLYMGLAPYRYGNEYQVPFTLYELENQMIYNEGFDDLLGSVMFSMRSLRFPQNPTMQQMTELLKDRWSYPTFIPRKTGETIVNSTLPTITTSRHHNGVRLHFAPLEQALGYVIFRFDKTEPTPYTTTKEKMIGIVHTTKDGATYLDMEAVDDASYAYIVRPFYRNGQISTLTRRVDVNAYLGNNAPSIGQFSTLDSIYGPQEKIMVHATILDTNQDLLEITIYYLDSVSNVLFEKTIVGFPGEYYWEINPMVNQKEAQTIRLTVSDGLENVMEEITFLVDPDSTILEKILIQLKSSIETIVERVFKGEE